MLPSEMLVGGERTKVHFYDSLKELMSVLIGREPGRL